MRFPSRTCNASFLLVLRCIPFVSSPFSVPKFPFRLGLAVSRILFSLQALFEPPSLLCFSILIFVLRRFCSLPPSLFLLSYLLSFFFHSSAVLLPFFRISPFSPSLFLSIIFPFCLFSLSYLLSFFSLFLPVPPPCSGWSLLSAFPVDAAYFLFSFLFSDCDSPSTLCCRFFSSS